MIGKNLFDDLETIAAGREAITALTEQGIQAYDDLFRHIQNDTLSEPIQSAVFTLVNEIADAPDRRRTIPLLIKFLVAKDPLLRFHIAYIFEEKRPRRAVNPLIKLLSDLNEVTDVRFEAAYALCWIDDERAIPALRAVALDTAEDPRVRSIVIEWMRDTSDTVADSITLLNDVSTDVRFWAAYRLSQTYEDISPAFDALDHAAAYDHQLPQDWGWHIDREALYGLERFNLRRLGYVDEESDDWSRRAIRFISPVPEFISFVREYRTAREIGVYDTAPVPAVEVSINAGWLRQQIGQAWPSAAFDTREPKPVTYTLNWALDIDGQPLLGGLHRDGYLLVLSGNKQAIFAFASWYRQLMKPDMPLFLYGWADEAAALTPGMSTAEIEAADRGF